MLPFLNGNRQLTTARISQLITINTNYQLPKERRGNIMATTTTNPTDAKRRPALGKGIESLLGPRPAAVNIAAAAEEQAGTPFEIRVDRIQRNPFQTRSSFDEGKLKELTDSIAATGVVQPIVVRELAGTGGRYQLIAGERRWRASQAPRSW